MATRTQIRRGTTNDNNNFKGFIGELTMDTTTKTLRIHDGSKTGGYKIPTLIESYQSGYNWYRKYSDGWIEQGNTYYTVNSNRQTVPLVVAMKDTNYCLQITGVSGTNITHDSVGIFGSAFSKTTTNYIVYTGDDSSFNTGVISWYVCGFYQ